MDKVTPSVRRRTMQAVRRKDTTPEMAVRRALRSLGCGYRLHDPKLPGTPDIVFPGRRKVIFVHGCFWHGHDCRVSLTPKTSVPFWTAKIVRNRERDANNLAELADLGWSTLVVWECATKKCNRDELMDMLGKFVSGKSCDEVATAVRISLPTIQKAKTKVFTPAQSLAVQFFDLHEWRQSYPVVNARTALSLVNKGILEQEIRTGKRWYRLTAEGGGYKQPGK